MADPTLERELAELAVDWPATPDLASAVATRIEAAPPPARRGAARSWLALRPGFAVAVAALLVAAVVTLAASPSARSAVLEFLGLRSARIERREPVATPRAAAPLGADLGLGRPVSLATARRRAGFAVLVPASLGAPGAVYLDEPPSGPRVSLVYGPRAGLPRAAATGAGLLVQHFAATARPVIDKAVGGAVSVDRLSVQGAPAYFLRGAHGFAFVGPGREPEYEEQRLAGNTLLLERGGILTRIEGEAGRARMLRLARELR